MLLYHFVVDIVLQIYVNGVSGSDTPVAPSAYTAQQSASITIGIDYDGSSDPFNGAMSCLQIFNKVLTKDELMGHQYRCQEDVGLPSMMM